MTLHEIVLTSLPSSGRVYEILTARNAFFLLCGWIVYQLLRAAWNISPFHPLHHIPGPKLAAATYLPEFWYDLVLFGRYTHEIKKMHEVYGPVIRVNPDEVHCSDVEFLDEIYTLGGRKRDKPRHQVSGSAMAYSGFATSEHDLHRLRRAPLGKFFSRNQIARLEPRIQELVQRLCDKLLSEAGKNKPLSAQVAYSCFTSDVISDYCFGESFGFLDREAWEPNFREPLYSLLHTLYVFRFFPFLKPITVVAGLWFLNYLPEDAALLIRTLNIDLPNQIKKTKSDMDAGIVHERQTVFGELLKSDLPPQEKSVARLTGEASAVLGGGTETLSWALAAITYFLLTQPRTLTKLTEELRTAVSDPQNLPPFTALEQLPYLGAVIQEGLRLTYGVPGRTARVATEEDLVYRGQWTPRGKGESVKVEYVIPRGFAAGMSNGLTHHNEAYFPDSYSYIPERWLDDNGKRRKELDRYLMSFGKGTRICLGMNLALYELHLVLAALVLRVFPHMRLFETTEADVRWDCDMVVPQTRAESKGIRVVIV
ncbi:cytochrome P450 [Hypoxylon sp. FL0890]|nr:cytochrome P450 [Hypoxylon sp. FL0890]